MTGPDATETLRKPAAVCGRDCEECISASLGSARRLLVFPQGRFPIVSGDLNGGGVPD